MYYNWSLRKHGEKEGRMRISKMIKDIIPIYSKGSEDPKQDKHKENHGRHINSFLPVFPRQSKNLTGNQIKGSRASSHCKQWEPVDNVIFNVLNEK